MNKRSFVSHHAALLTVLIALTGFAAAARTYGQTADQWVTSGRNFLTQHQLANANAAFAQAVLADPSHQEGNFFYACTRIVSLISSNGPGTVGGLLDGFGLATTGRDPWNWTADFRRDLYHETVFPTDSPDSGVVLGVLTNTVVPQIDGALANLAALQTNFVTHIDVEIGRPAGTQKEVDYGDVLTLKTMLTTARALLLVLSSYDLTVDLDDLFRKAKAHVLNVNDVLDLYPRLLALAPSAGTALPSAKTLVLDAIQTYSNALLSVQGETDSQTNDIATLQRLGGEDVTTSDLNYNDATGSGSLRVESRVYSNGTFRTEQRVWVGGLVKGSTVCASSDVLISYANLSALQFGPPAVGQSWSGSFNSPKFPPQRDATALVTAINATVTVAAGTFSNCVRIVETLTYPAGTPPAPYPVQCERWFAPGVGPVKMIEHENNSSTCTEELQSYTVNGAAPDDYLPVDLGNTWAFNIGGATRTWGVDSVQQDSSKAVKLREKLPTIVAALLAPTIVNPTDVEPTRVDASRFFDTPQSLRDLLPQFCYDPATHRTQVLAGTVPDPTLGGIFPDLTQTWVSNHVHTVTECQPSWLAYLASFGDNQTGSGPIGNLTASGSTLYGLATIDLTKGGGPSNGGLLFQVNADGTGYANLYTFGFTGDDTSPQGSVTVAGSNLFGVTSDGGSDGLGSVYRINSNGTGYTNLHSFAGSPTDGSYPYDGLTLVGSTLYGLTSSGGESDLGTIFRINTDGTGYTNLYSFSGAPDDGSVPDGALLAAGSTLYGLTQSGGGNDLGGVFSISTNGTGFAILHSFAGGPADGDTPVGSLVLSGSMLYGVTSGGGSNSVGTVFTVGTNATNSAVLHSFADAPDGANPTGGLALLGSTLHGLTAAGGGNGNGTGFFINTDGTGYGVATWPDANGGNPVGAPVIIGTTLYGLTDSGGDNGQGGIFIVELAPQIKSVSPLPAGTVGADYDFQLQVYGGTPVYSWALISNGVPAGLSFDNSQGTIAGIPAVATTTNFSVRVASGNGLQSEKTFALTIHPATLAPTITTGSPLPSGTVATSYSVTLTATNGTAPYTWTETGPLPAGLSLSNSTGVISGTPTAAVIASFTVRCTDHAGQYREKAFGLTINDIPNPPTITTVSLPSGTYGTAYSTTLAASGGTTPYAWSVIGALPYGLSLVGSAGVISGTPWVAGTAGFTIRCTGHNGQHADKVLSLTINPIPSAPVITTSTPLPTGVTGTLYHVALAATGGATPYSWSIISGSLPAGLGPLSTNGVISGTPTAGGPASFVVQVTGADSRQSEKSFNLTIISGGGSELSGCATQAVVLANDLAPWYSFHATAAANLFVTMRQSETAYWGWYNTVTLIRTGQTVATISGYSDQLLQFPHPTAGDYTVVFGASNMGGPGSAIVSVCTNLPALVLGQWQVGTIYSQGGSAWYQVDVPAGQAQLTVAAEAVGLYSQLSVYADRVGGTLVGSGSGPSMSATVASPAAGRYYIRLTDSAYIQNVSQAREHMIKADVVPFASPACVTPLITSFTPSAGGTAGAVTITIEGQCLSPTATVCLHRTGSPDVCAVAVSGASNRVVYATFDLSGAAPGDYQLVLTNPDTHSATAAALFRVEAAGAAPIEVDLIGRAQIRAERLQTYILRYVNTGLIDATNVLLWVGITAGPGVTMALPDVTPYVLQQPGPGTLAVQGVLFPRIPAGFAGTVTLKLWAPQTFSWIRLAAGVCDTVSHVVTPDITRGTFMDIQVVTSISPEDKYGPAGYDAAGTDPGQLKRWIAPDQSVDYRIDFWNREDAPAATVDVFITDQLSTNLDWSTFVFTEIGFLDWHVPLEPCQFFNIDVPNVHIDLAPYFPGAAAADLTVNVQGTFDPATGAISWEFHALDPATRLAPEDPFAGFLPPITSNGWEIGWVNFSAVPKAGLPSGTVIGNQSSVKFDVDVFKPAPPAGPFHNTIDSVAPASHVNALAVSSPASFVVAWQGTDAGSGVQDYTIYSADNGGLYTPWCVHTNATSATFTGQAGHSYAFYSVARDNVGNTEAAPGSADATTHVLGSFSVVTSASPPASGSTSGDGSQLEGASVTVTATASPCSHFINWTEGDTVVSTSAAFTFPLTANRNLVAHFSDDRFPAICGMTVSNALLTLHGLPVAIVNQPLILSASGRVADGKTLSNQWVFCDGTTNSGATVSHQFAQCGPCPVAVSISDGQTVVVSNLTVDVACDLDAACAKAKTQVKLNFARTKADSFSFSACVDLPATVQFSGQVLLLNLGGAEVSFTLDAKGRAANAAGSCKLTRSKTGGQWLLAVKGKAGAWHDDWAEYGLVNATVKPARSVTIPVVLTIGDEAFATTKTLSYTAKAGKTGKAQ